MSKHTPGPWKAVNQTTSTLLKQDSPQGRYLFSLKEYPGIPESEANARLIAAAPDLAEAVRELLATHPAAYREPGKIDNRTDNAVKIARAAIAKAEGAS